MDYKYIHLLYVPTMACNMCCKYCYLENNTIDEKTDKKVLETLDFAVKKFKKEKVIPFNISLHWGEVTTLSKNDFHDIIKYIFDYYKKNKKIILDGGFKLGAPHIKTNLYNLENKVNNKIKNNKKDNNFISRNESNPAKIRKMNANLKNEKYMIGVNN